MCDSAYTWGSGLFGRMGLGDDRDYEEPQKIQHALLGCELRSVGAGLFHSALVTTSGEVYACGSNATSCLGLEEASGTPRRINAFPANIKIAQVACVGDLSGAFTLAVSESGKLFAWGRRVGCGLGKNDEDEVTEPTLVTRFQVGDKLFLKNPPSVTFVAGGGSAAACLTSDGHVYTWGYGGDGRLGYPSRTVQWRPRRVENLINEQVKSLAVGSGHMMASTVQGSLYVWGVNEYGQLGLGDLSPRVIPKKVELPRGSIAWGIVAAGDRHSLACDTSGRLFVWGGLGGGSLGNGGVFARKVDDIQVQMLIEGVPGAINKIDFSWARPELLHSLEEHQIIRISAGGSASVAITSRGKVFTWEAKHGGFPKKLDLPLTVCDAVNVGNHHSIVLGSVSNRSLTGMARDLPGIVSNAVSEKFCTIVSSDGIPFSISIPVFESRVSPNIWSIAITPQLNKNNSETTDLLDIFDDIRSLEKIKNPSAKPLPIDVPASAKLSSYHSRVLHVFFYFIYTDCLFPSFSGERSSTAPVLTDESELQKLGSLATCLGLDRLVKLVDKRLFEISSHSEGSSSFALIPKPNWSVVLENSWKSALLRSSEGDCKLLCQEGMSLRCHSWIFYDTAMWGLLSQQQPAAAAGVSADGTLTVTAFAGFKKKVVADCIGFMYIGRFPGHTSSSLYDLKDALMVAQIIGNSQLLCHIESLLVSLINPQNWMDLLGIAVSQPKASCSMLREACILIPIKSIFKECRLSFIDKKLNEISEFATVESVMANLVEVKLEPIRRKWPKVAFEIQARLRQEIEAAYHAKNMIKTYFDSLEVSNGAGAVGDPADAKVSSWKREINNEPSLFAATKDLGLVLLAILVFALITRYGNVLGNFFGEPGGFVTKLMNSGGGGAIVIVLNLAAGYLVYRLVQNSMSSF
jgi:alpha-tubulin suppressor-like RCC1 family protein